MSGPVSTADVAAESVASEAEACDVEITEDRRTELGIVTIRRALPREGRRTVGAWCFVDHMGPDQVIASSGQSASNCELSLNCFTGGSPGLLGSELTFELL